MEGRRKTGDIGGEKMILVVRLALGRCIPEIQLEIIVNDGALLCCKK